MRLLEFPGAADEIEFAAVVLDGNGLLGIGIAAAPGAIDYRIRRERRHRIGVDDETGSFDKIKRTDVDGCAVGTRNQHAMSGRGDDLKRLGDDRLVDRQGNLRRARGIGERDSIVNPILPVRAHIRQASLRGPSRIVRQIGGESNRLELRKLADFDDLQGANASTRAVLSVIAAGLDRHRVCGQNV